MLITFAVPHESRAWRARPGGKVARIVHTGIGAEAARRSLLAELQRDRPRGVIGSGFAGALDPQLRVGDLVVDTEHSTLLELIPGEAVRGRFHMANAAIASAAEKAELREKSGGCIAVDMESAAIAAACRDAGVPFLGLRVISDAAHDPLPVPLSVAWDLRRQRARPWSVALWLARHPRQIAPFAVFLRATNLAAERLAGGLEAVLGRV